SMVPPWALMDSATSRSVSSERAAASTLAPRWAATSAKARPMPCDAPVISMRAPFTLRRWPMDSIPQVADDRFGNLSHEKRQFTGWCGVVEWINGGKYVGADMDGRD